MIAIMKKVMLLAYLLFNAHSASAACDAKALQFTVASNKSEPVDLCKYHGKVLLVVNTASECGFTGQYKGLEALNKKYKSKGLEVLGFPSNDFMGQEPGSNEDIAKFCQLNYGVSFDLFAKSHVKGDEINPFYKYLTTQSPHPGSVSWNFNKFLINRSGQVIARFGSNTKPDDKDLVNAIKTAIEK